MITTIQRYKAKQVFYAISEITFSYKTFIPGKEIIKTYINYTEGLDLKAGSTQTDVSHLRKRARLRTLNHM